jgi:urease accessory protein
MPLDCLLPETRWRAKLALAFERRGERSVLASREHDGPLVVQKALHPEGPEVCHAIVVHPPAGIAGGDELVMEVAAREGSRALLTTPGAAKWYRSSGAWARQRVSIEASRASHVEWLPQETIVFDGALADIEFEARLHGDATLIAWDMVRLGRTASGERFEKGRVNSSLRIVRDGRLAWVERARIDPQAAIMHGAAGLAGEPLFATMVCASMLIDDECLAHCRGIAAAPGESAVTRLPGLLVARYRGASTSAVRDYFAALWSILRPRVSGREAVEPRIWST